MSLLRNPWPQVLCLTKPSSLSHAGWLTEPKMTSEVRSAWMDIWDRCDSGFGSMVRSEVKSAAPSGKQEMAATKA